MKFEEDNKPTSWKSGSPLIFLYLIFSALCFAVKFVFRNDINNCAPGKLKCLWILSGDIVELAGFAIVNQERSNIIKSKIIEPTESI